MDSKEKTPTKTFTEIEVESLVKIAVSEAILGMNEWLKVEADIVDKDSRDVLVNAELALKKTPKSILLDYIYPRLLKHGIKVTTD